MGILIPPSVPLVVYAILTEQNIAKLFAAAMVPGILAMLGYIVVIALYCRVRPEFATPSAPCAWSERGKALVTIWPIVGIFVIVFGGIYGGIFSPTEGAAIGALLPLPSAWHGVSWALLASSGHWWLRQKQAPWFS